MFQNHKLNRNKNKKVKNTVSFLTQFVTNTPTLGATKPGRKSTSVVLILQLSANSLFTLKTQDLPVQISTQELLDLRSHLTILQSVTAHVTYQTKTQNTNGEVTFKQTTNTLLTSLGQHTRVYNSTHSPKHVSQTIQERLTIKRTKLAST